MFNFRAMVGLFARHQVDYAIVGGLAGVMQGAPINTQDLDILYSLQPPHPQRLLNAVREMEAVFGGDHRNISPDLSHMESKGHKLLVTMHGRVDCLGTIEESTTLEDIRNDLDEMELDGVSVKVISLPRLIEVKKKLGRPKDQWALLHLVATLEEREKKGR